MALEKAAIKTQLKALVPGTKEHKAREAGDPAYHLGNVGSDDHRVHTGFGITGKMQPKINKAHETKGHTKDKLHQHVLRGHDIKRPMRDLRSHGHAEAPARTSNDPGLSAAPEMQAWAQQQQQQEAPGAAGEMLKGLGLAPK